MTPCEHNLTTTHNATPLTAIDVWFKPVGRGRKFDRLARGLARRMRLPFVRSTLWERDNPQAGRSASYYGPMWTSNNALANTSFACTCHKRERYDRRRGR